MARHKRRACTPGPSLEPLAAFGAAALALFLPYLFSSASRLWHFK